jgi:hypothetical protein
VEVVDDGRTPGQRDTAIACELEQLAHPVAVVVVLNAFPAYQREPRIALRFLLK